MRASNDDIVRVASLMVAFEREEADDSHTGKLLDREMRKLDRADVLLTIFVSKMIAGKPYRMVSDDPDTVNRARALAEHVGATMAFKEQGGGRTEIVFTPPS